MIAARGRDKEAFDINLSVSGRAFLTGDA